MKKNILLVFITLLIFLFGCKKERDVFEEKIPTSEINQTSTQNLSIEEESKENLNITSQQPATLQDIIQTQKSSSEDKPSAQDIQIALKNVGFYTAEIDGKIGPKTKEAIRKFQEKNNLEVDGKVGPKTWAVLKKYLKKEIPSN